MVPRVCFFFFSLKLSFALPAMWELLVLLTWLIGAACLGDAVKPRLALS